MRASIKWLKDYVDFTQTPEELADMMTMAGVPVENIEYLGQGIEKIVTGKIVELKSHPNANKLQICKVEYQRGSDYHRYRSHQCKRRGYSACSADRSKTSGRNGDKGSRFSRREFPRHALLHGRIESGQ